MASQPGRQKPAKDLVGIDPAYNPSVWDDYWDKDALLNNCSISAISGLRHIHKWDKFFEYFWNHKRENCDLQTPGALVVTLCDYQMDEIEIAIKQGFIPIAYSPSCHHPHRCIVTLLKNNPILEKKPRFLESRELVQRSIADWQKEYSSETTDEVAS